MICPNVCSTRTRPTSNDGCSKRALEKKPSPAASARMAKALGVTVAAVGTLPPLQGAGRRGGGGESNRGGAATTTVWPWVSVGVLGLVVAGAVVGTRRRQPSRPPNILPCAFDAGPPGSRASAGHAEPAGRRRGRTGAAAPAARSVAAAPPRPAADAADQIAFIDAARAAVSAGSDRRALEILRRYQDKYPGRELPSGSDRAQSRGADAN